MTGRLHGKPGSIFSKFRARLNQWGGRLVATFLLVILAGLRVWDPAPVESVRLRTFDLFQILQPRIQAANPVLIVDIDEQSLREIGQWPWPRDQLANLVKTIRKNGALVTGFDFLFAEPDRLSPSNIANRYRDLPPDAVAILQRMRSNDDLFAEAIKTSKVVVGRAASIAPPPSGQSTVGPTTPVAQIGADPRPYLLTFPVLLQNIPQIEQAAAGRGLFALQVEHDTIVRRVPALYRIGDQIFPSLVVEMLRVDNDENAIAVQSNEAGIQSVVVGKHRIQTDRLGRIWVHYSRSTPERYVRASDVLQGRVPPNSFAGKMVLIGTSAAGLLDLKATPLARALPGVEVHAQLLETILSNKVLVRPNIALSIELVILLISCALMIVLVPLLGAKWTLALGALIEMPLFGSAWYAYSKHALLIDVAYPAGAALAVFTFLTAINYLHDEAEKRRIRAAFSRYMSPELVARLAENSQELALGGEQKDMTLLFTDIHGFTGISEHYRAVDLTDLVNDIFNPLTHAILEHGGTVDKYMGDSIMAFWNAPLDDADHARHACLAALEMQKRIPALNQGLEAKAGLRGHVFRPVKLGIGINTGECCVGNMGSDLRFDYSVLGDTVNIAARLEGQTRAYGTNNVIGEPTRNLVSDLAFLELDLTRVVGKETPVRIFTLVGDEKLAVDGAFEKFRTHHDDMLAAYRSMAWSEALDRIDTCEALGREIEAMDFTALYAMFRARIIQMHKIPPKEDWDAVFDATSKG